MKESTSTYISASVWGAIMVFAEFMFIRTLFAHPKDWIAALAILFVTALSGGSVFFLVDEANDQRVREEEAEKDEDKNG